MSALPIYPPTQQPKVLIERDVINQLRGFTYERKHAIKKYPNAHGAQQKLQAADEVLMMLDEAALFINPSQAIKQVLKTALNLHFIAPHATRKLHQTWYEKIEGIMEACRQYLGRRKQQ